MEETTLVPKSIQMKNRLKDIIAEIVGKTKDLKVSGKIQSSLEEKGVSRHAWYSYLRNETQPTADRLFLIFDELQEHLPELNVEDLMDREEIVIKSKLFKPH